MPGERRLIIGPNGAGKTTLFNLVTGDLTADGGSVRLFGRELLGMPTQRRVHLGLARTYQILTLFPRERLVHNVVLSLLGLDRRRWNPWSVLTGSRDLYANAREALERVGLGEAAERIVVETSYGERRRLELAMALAQKPKVLLLDEPLAGLSQAERQTVRALLDAIPRDVTIVMIEHDMDTALGFAERITVLHYGEVIVEGTRAEVVADPRTRVVYLGDLCTRHRWRGRLLRRQPRAARRVVRAAAGSPARPARPQRRRQDHLHGHYHGLPAAAGLDQPLRRAGRRPLRPT
jgi:branched-chain amino acid transport system ATP-binding protein